MLAREVPWLPASPSLGWGTLTLSLSLALAAGCVARVRRAPRGGPGGRGAMVLLKIGSDGSIALLTPDRVGGRWRLGPGTRLLGPTLVLDLIEEHPQRAARRRLLLWLSQGDLPWGILRRMILGVTTSHCGGRP